MRSRLLRAAINAAAARRSRLNFGLDPSDFMAFAPEDARLQFSYGSEQVSHGTGQVIHGIL
jgi:hypothetical protein